MLTARTAAVCRLTREGRRGCVRRIRCITTRILKRIIFLPALAALLCGACSSAVPEDYTQYVDPYIGTGDHGHVFMGANVPFGFVQLGPTSIPQTWDWCSGYNYADTTVIGFGHTHLSGTGIGDLNDISLMPVVGKVTPGRGTARRATMPLACCATASASS